MRFEAAKRRRPTTSRGNLLETRRLKAAPLHFSGRFFQLPLSRRRAFLGGEGRRLGRTDGRKEGRAAVGVSILFEWTHYSILWAASADVKSCGADYWACHADCSTAPYDLAQSTPVTHIQKIRNCACSSSVRISS